MLGQFYSNITNRLNRDNSYISMRRTGSKGFVLMPDHEDGNQAEIDKLMAETMAELNMTATNPRLTRKSSLRRSIRKSKSLKFDQYYNAESAELMQKAVDLKKPSPLLSSKASSAKKLGGLNSFLNQNENYLVPTAGQSPKAGRTVLSAMTVTTPTNKQVREHLDAPHSTPPAAPGSRTSMVPGRTGSLSLTHPSNPNELEDEDDGMAELNEADMAKVHLLPSTTGRSKGARSRSMFSSKTPSAAALAASAALNPLPSTPVPGLKVTSSTTTAMGSNNSNSGAPARSWRRPTLNVTNPFYRRRPMAGELPASIDLGVDLSECPQAREAACQAYSQAMKHTSDVGVATKAAAAAATAALIMSRQGNHSASAMGVPLATSRSQGPRNKPLPNTPASTSLENIPKRRGISTHPHRELFTHGNKSTVDITQMSRDSSKKSLLNHI
ncbi:hypothetical protein BJ085DRAFT_30045 [Dimargaris cristalligena]|uniref:Uncharacterized protein n=1 Tax=Dimargaris cristalligena TaxID=215637 RepID=A0A4P9ZQV0_9FUNG|nr:hypothetical protein BJ085DRAFT_30045 [Dimargaris cristalligena]|eukprot:RKP35111.1 hypothetical protein BJ085DRAFT_30045 [Dimargaris cristalligena]